MPEVCKTQQHSSAAQVVLSRKERREYQQQILKTSPSLPPPIFFLSPSHITTKYLTERDPSCKILCNIVLISLVWLAIFFINTSSMGLVGYFNKWRFCLDLKSTPFNIPFYYMFSLPSIVYQNTLKTQSPGNYITHRN